MKSETNSKTWKECNAKKVQHEKSVQWKSGTWKKCNMKIVQHKQSIETGQKIVKEECTIVNKRITSSVNEPLYTGRKICDYP